MKSRVLTRDVRATTGFNRHKESDMNEFDRRKFLQGSASLAAGGALGAGALWAPAVHAQALSFKPEKGAKLLVLRWSRFVQGDIDAYMGTPTTSGQLWWACPRSTPCSPRVEVHSTRSQRGSRTSRSAATTSSLWPHDMPRRREGTYDPSEGQARREAWPTPADSEYQALMEAAPHQEPRRTLEEGAALREVLARTIDMTLDEREPWIFNALVVERRSIRATADDLSLSKTQVHRIQQASIAKLQEALT